MRALKHICRLFVIFVIAATLSSCESENKRTRRLACSQLEWEVQNAAQCLANPRMWSEWSKINEAYGVDKTKNVGEIGCPIFISKMKTYGFMSEDSALLDYFVKTYGKTGGIKHRFKKETGQDFCKVAEEKGWLDKQGRLNTPF